MEPLLHLACPHCAAINRLRAARLGDGPVCGQCHRALFEARPLELDAQSFERHARRSELPLLIDFWAAWCGPCQMMAPEFAEAAPQLEPALRLAKLDTERHPAIAAQFVIRSIPTMVLVRQGRELARQSGAMRSAEIVRWARERLAAAG